MAQGKTMLFVIIITFWTLLTILGNVFDYQLSQTHITEITDISTIEDEDPSLLTSITDFLDTIPIVKYFTPLFKMVSFQYSSEIPPLVSIFLSMFGIFSVYIIVSTLFGK